MGDGEKLLTHLNSALKVLLGLYIFPRVPKKKLNFVDQCYCSDMFRSQLLAIFRELVIFLMCAACMAIYLAEVLNM